MNYRARFVSPKATAEIEKKQFILLVLHIFNYYFVFSLI